MVDHVKQYKIPKQYMYLSDDEKGKGSDSDESDIAAKLDKR